MEITKVLRKRRIMLVFATLAMLVAGIIYAWSILKMPFSEELSMSPSELSLNFTLTMSFFCIGGVIASMIIKIIGVKFTIIASGILSGLGFCLTGIVSDGSPLLLYFTYSVMSGLGIGIAYNAIISSLNAWFVDKKGFCSGCMMMGFGASSLILGNLSSELFDIPEIGWRNTYIILGALLLIVLCLAGVIISRPTPDTVLPEPKKRASNNSENFEVKDLTSFEMIKRFSFWRAFICLVCLTAVGNSVISFAHDLAVSVGALEDLATILVGVLSVFNGIGRIITGAVFDKFGRRITMIGANILTITAASITLLSVVLSSVPLCIVGLCLTGMSYGSSPTVSSAFASSFYGQKHFASNFGIMNFNLMGASFIASGCTALYVSSNGYIIPFVLLLSLSLFALVLNLSIRHP